MLQTVNLYPASLMLPFLGNDAFSRHHHGGWEHYFKTLGSPNLLCSILTLSGHLSGVWVYPSKRSSLWQGFTPYLISLPLTSITSATLITRIHTTVKWRESAFENLRPAGTKDCHVSELWKRTSGIKPSF
jgi:hypothetical protein